MPTGGGTPGEMRDVLPPGRPPSSRGGEAVLDLIKVQARLRAEDGCPWDREQTHRSLARHLLEETHEVLEAIDAGDSDAIREELGDVLLQVTFHAQIAADEGRWDVDDVAGGLVRKLIHRHPHVFGDVHVESSDEVLANWEQIKAAERDAHGLDDEIPATLPALARAGKVQRRAAGVGPEAGRPRATAALAELRSRIENLDDAAGAPDADERFGDALFAAVTLARALDVDPEGALRGATRRFAEAAEARLRPGNR